ncbi:uncharacterized protein LOC108219815 isoform X3 [Daucus carota subsp. sativus]|uniref:uncharacterized protein LOC108219815 isoform X3 n=1 Tax=Daucus carota subsp. sativus TaxID=79200 RepID=UPI003082BD7E
MYRFVKLEDQKRTLVSRLLQYTLVHEVLQIPIAEILINRTLEGKPFLEYKKSKLAFPNFNFNVSHHGDYVAIASEPICLVGVDIVSHSTPEKETVLEFIQNFSTYFSSLEWDKIYKAGSDDDILLEFYSLHFHRYWCVKESFVKAIGNGVGYKLDGVEFHHREWTNIRVNINGAELKDWKFWLSSIGKNHMLSVARGHPRIAAESYRKTLDKTQFDENEYKFGLNLPNSSFVLRTVEQLISIFLQSPKITRNMSRKSDNSEDRSHGQLF